MTELDNIQRIAKLPLEMRTKLFARLKTQKALGDISQTRIRPRSSETHTFPLSFAQQRLWFLAQLEPTSTAYHIPTALRLRGTLHEHALEHSLQELVHRHHILRTTFLPQEEGSALQYVQPFLPQPLLHLDLQSLPPTLQQEEVHRLSEQQARTPFDLVHGPLLRTALLQLAPQEHILLLVFHHIIFDGWSTSVFIDELSTLYSAFVQDRPSPLAALPIQYADYALWQRQWLQGEVLQQQLAYWREQLRELPTLQLPTDHPRPAVQRFRGARYFFTLPVSLTQALKALSQQEGTTLFMTLLAGFAILLARYSGQEDIAVGTFLANRTRQELEGLLGFFVNTLVLRTDLSGNPSVRDLLGRVRQTALDAYTHQDLPFERLVEVLAPARDLSRQPLFQVAFQLWSLPLSAPELPGVQVEVQRLEAGTATFDLTLELTQEDAGDLKAILEYDTDLFEEERIVRLAQHYQVVIEAMVADAQQHLTDLPLLTTQERQQLLIEWNATQHDYPLDRCIHELFEAQVERTPDAVALVFQEELLTYHELNRRANYLAHFLQQQGVAPESRVGLLLERSLEMPIALLGVLKAGAAYVPLDPTTPQERLRFICADSQIVLLLSHHRLLDELSRPPVQILDLDLLTSELSGSSSTLPQRAVSTSNLAYVIYTSGSTGQPKGVLITHQNIVSSTFARLAYYQQRIQRLLLVLSLAFDIAGASIFRTLSQGGTLVLAPQGSEQDIFQLAKILSQKQISHFPFLPSSYLLLLEQGTASQLSSLREVALGGEPCSSHLLERHIGMLPHISLFNEYGVTEATVWSTVFGDASACKSVSVPIGRPIANTQTYILDAQLQPVPVGVPGELYIGGAGVARGYLNQPDLTGARFLPDPFSFRKGARFYRTGDLARYLLTGEIEYLGRLDNQVKLRGFRIELGEIETVLRQFPLVCEVVVVQEDIAGYKQLVAYIVPLQDQRPTVNDLRSFLRERVPDYMVPATFVLLDVLPLTPNGKVDRKALSTFASLQPNLEGNCVAPRNGLEKRLIQIWEDVLNIHPIGVTDNFFALGGNSFSAVRLMYRIKQQFAQDLPLSMLFQNATIEHLACALPQQTPALSRSPLVAILPGGTRRPFFCVHPGGGGVLCYHALSQFLGSDQPFYALEDVRQYQEEMGNLHIEDMAFEYLQALREVQPDGPYQLGGWSLGGLIAFEMAQQLQDQRQEVALLAILDTQPPDLLSQLMEVDEAVVLIQMVRALALTEGKDVVLSIDQMRQHEQEQQLQYVIEQMKAADLSLSEIGLPGIHHYLRRSRAMKWAVQNYTSRLYQGRITLFHSDEIDQAELQYLQGPVDPALYKPTYGWEKLSSQPVDIRAVPGTHATMMFNPHVKALAEQLRRCLVE